MRVAGIIGEMLSLAGDLEAEAAATAAGSVVASARVCAAVAVGSSLNESPVWTDPETAIVIPPRLRVGPVPSALVCPVAVFVASNPLAVLVRMKSPGTNWRGSVMEAARVPLPRFVLAA